MDRGLASGAGGVGRIRARQHRLKGLARLLLGLSSIPLLGLAPLRLAQPALAQLADVVTPDEEGNFDSVHLQGARGFYPQRQWLVVDRGSGGLRCRDVNGTVLVALRYGSVIDTDLNAMQASAISTDQGKPWLRVRVTPADFQADYRDRRFQNQLAICRVRAHVNYLAPINPDTITP